MGIVSAPHTIYIYTRIYVTVLCIIYRADTMPLWLHVKKRMKYVEKGGNRITF